MICCRSFLGSAVLALAMVETPKTVASAKTANFDTRTFCCNKALAQKHAGTRYNRDS